MTTESEPEYIKKFKTTVGLFGLPNVEMQAGWFSAEEARERVTQAINSSYSSQTPKSTANNQPNPYSAEVPQSGFYPQQSQENQQAQWQQGWGNVYTGISTSFPPQTKSKPEYKPEDFHGRFCAFVIATIGEDKHTGILFVKKCGYWKLLEYNGHKVAGGGVGTFEEKLRSGELKLTVIQTFYDADRIEQEEDTDLEIV